MVTPEYFQGIPRYLTQAEVRAFLSAITSPRDRTLFAVIYHYGLRVSEVGLLLRANVDLTRDRIIVKRVKGGSWSERPLFATTRTLLTRHLAVQDGVPTDPLFPGRGGPLRKRQIQELYERYRNRAGLERRSTCHSLRHSIATHLLDAGMSLEFVQDHLGHRRIETTTIYARITDRHRAARFRELERSPWIVQPSIVAEETPSPSEGKENVE